MTKTQKKELKARLFKILHGICYVLSAIFVLVLIIAGVKGCSSKKQRSNTMPSIAPQQLIYNNDLPFQYFEIDIAQNSNVSLDLEYQQNLVGSAYDLSLSGANSEYYMYLYESSNQGYVYAIETEEYLVQSIVIYLDYYEYSATDDSTYLRVREVYVRYDSYNHLIYSKVNEYASDDQYSTDEYATRYRVSSDYVITFSEPLLNNIFTPVATSGFTFNKAFNYNAPMGVSFDTPYYTRPSGMSDIDGAFPYITYNVGLFYSNGEFFDTIRWQWIATLGAVYYDFGNNNIKKGPLGTEQGSYLYLKYINSQSGVERIVNNRDQIAFQPDSNAYAYYTANSSTWVNDEYRYIKFFEPISDSVRVSLKAFNNNNDYGLGGLGNGDYNIFSIIGSAFTGIIPILSIAVLPNITLGMLLFVPLVAILVLAIVKIVKK